MSDIRKILDQLSEMATTSGSVAAVAQPMGGVKSRKKDSIFYEGEKCTSCGCEPCKCDSSEGNAVDGTKTPQSPNVSEFGLWKNSALIGQEQREKKKKKSVKESRKAVPYEGDREYNALDDVQDQIAKMAHRHKDEKWTMDDYKRLGKKLAQHSSKTKLDELGNSLMPGGQRSLHLAQETFVDPRNSRRHPGAVDENSGKQVDMTGKKCSSCKKGTYQETSQHDDMDGVLHCTKCRKEVKRHQTVSSKKKEVDEGLGKSIKRAAQGWGSPQDKPADIVKRNKGYDIDTAKKVRAGIDNASDHSPQGLQKRVLDRKLKGVDEGILDEHGDPWEDPNYDPRGGGETRSPEQIAKDNAEHAILSKKLGLKNTNKLPDIKDDLLKMMNHYLSGEAKKKK
jgi:hypothetical protein